MAKKTITLSVALAVYNEENNIVRCLSSIRDIADEIVMVDGGSIDKTVEFAKKFGAKILVTDNPPIFHINKEKALNMANGEWVLQLDADEVVDSKLREEIIKIINDTNSRDGYYIPRRNYFLGDWLRKGGQYPDYVIRLFRNGKGSFPQKSVHEQITIQGSIGHLSHPLDHFSYKSIDQYWKKSNVYISLTAADLKKHANSRSFPVAISYLFIQPIVTFFKIYVRHKGFIDGWRGMLFALYSAMHYPKAYIKYLS